VNESSQRPPLTSLSNHHTELAHPLEEIAAALRDLRFGSVNIIVQDGVVIQIDRTEKRRLRTRRN
jgi:hypothetical protein